MSLLGKKPNIEAILENLSSADLTTLSALLDTAPLSIPSYTAGTLPTNAGNVFLARVDGKSGYVVYSGGSKYLIAYSEQDCDEYKVVSNKLSLIDERLSILELRFEVATILASATSGAGKINVIDFSAIRSGTTLTCTSADWASTDIKTGTLYIIDIEYAIAGDTVSTDSVILEFSDGVTANIYSSINTTGTCKLLDLEQVQFPYNSNTGHRYIFEAIATTNVNGNVIMGMIPATSQQDIISITSEELLDIAGGTVPFEYNNEQLFYCTDTSANGYTMGHVYKASYNFATNEVTFSDITEIGKRIIEITTALSTSSFSELAITTDTTITFADTSTSTLCEYKAELNISVATAINITLPSNVTNIVYDVNDTTISINSNVVTITSGDTTSVYRLDIEVSDIGIAYIVKVK